MEGSAPNDRLHAQALVMTADPSALGERVAHALSGVWQASAGSARAGAATVDFHAWPDGLRLDAYATSEDELAAAERAVSEAVAASGARAIDWRTRPSTLPGAAPLEPPVYTFPFDDDDE
jgi:hypothetical protein